VLRFVGDDGGDEFYGSGGIEEDEGVVVADLVAGVDGLGEAKEGAVVGKGIGLADEDGGVLVDLREVSGEHNVLAELLVECIDNQRDVVDVKAGVVDYDVVDGDVQFPVAVGGLRAVEVEVDNLRTKYRRFRDDGLDTAVQHKKFFWHGNDLL